MLPELVTEFMSLTEGGRGPNVRRVCKQLAPSWLVFWFVFIQCFHSRPQLIFSWCANQLYFDAVLAARRREGGRCLPSSQSRLLVCLFVSSC